MDNDVQKSWERFLNPETLKTNLIAASIYIAAFEILKQSVVDRIKDFFSEGFDQTGRIIGEKYRQEVLSKNKSPTYASLLWLEGMGVITKSDIEKFEAIKAYRNVLAHEITEFLSKGSKFDHAELFGDMVNLVRKIEVWWIVNVEIPTNPDWDGKEIDEEGIIPGPIWSLQLMTEIALGNNERASYYYNEFIKSKIKI